MGSNKQTCLSIFIMEQTCLTVGRLIFHYASIISSSFLLKEKKQKFKTAKSQLRIVFVTLRQNNSLIGFAQTDFVV